MVGNHQKIYELGTNRRTRNKRKHTKEIRGKIAKVVEEEWREELLRDIQKIQKRNERGGLQQKSRVNGVVESENKQRKSRRELLAEKQGDMCGMQ